jgi:hypothetical protein
LCADDDLACQAAAGQSSIPPSELTYEECVTICIGNQFIFGGTPGEDSFGSDFSEVTTVSWQGYNQFDNVTTDGSVPPPSPVGGTVPEATTLALFSLGLVSLVTMHRGTRLSASARHS